MIECTQKLKEDNSNVQTRVSYRVQVASGRDDSGDEQEVHDGDKHIKVEEHDDLLATYIADTNKGSSSQHNGYQLTKALHPKEEASLHSKSKHTDGSVFGPDVVDHDGGHNQGNKVDDQGGYFCYDA